MQRRRGLRKDIKANAQVRQSLLIQVMVLIYELLWLDLFLLRTEGNGYAMLVRTAHKKHPMSEAT
jgi:hypothetical protein